MVVVVVVVVVCVCVCVCVCAVLSLPPRCFALTAPRLSSLTLALSSQRQMLQMCRTRAPACTHPPPLSLSCSALFLVSQSHWLVHHHGRVPRALAERYGVVETRVEQARIGAASQVALEKIFDSLANESSVPRLHSFVHDQALSRGM